MLVNFLIAAGAGVAIGCFFRAGTLIAASIVFLIYAATLPIGRDAISTIAISLALLTTIQGGYICGLALSGLLKKTVRVLKQKHYEHTELATSLKNGSRQSDFRAANFKRIP